MSSLTPIRIQSSPGTAAFAVLAALALASAPALAGGSSSSSSRSSTTTRTEFTSPGHSHWSSSTTDDGDSNGPDGVDAYVYSRDNGHWRDGSGSTRDWNEAEKLHMDENGPMLWFRRDDDRYIITDADALKDLGEIFKPQEELGKRQGELGARQGELGALQGQLGARQGRLGGLQAGLARREAEYQYTVASRSRRGEDIETTLRAEREAIRSQRDEISALQSELGELQSRLGERQSALGERQSALGAEQKRVNREVQRQLDTFTRDAIKSGAAKRVNP
jgi:hypothetical protein